MRDGSDGGFLCLFGRPGAPVVGPGLVFGPEKFHVVELVDDREAGGGPLELLPRG